MAIAAGPDSSAIDMSIRQMSITVVQWIVGFNFSKLPYVIVTLTKLISLRIGSIAPEEISNLKILSRLYLYK